MESNWIYGALPKGQKMIKNPKFLAKAEFSKDMIETLEQYFTDYEINGVVSVEVTSEGLWLPNPETGGRQFLGMAKLAHDQNVLH